MAELAETCVAPVALPEPGQLVRVRSRSWLVEEVVPPARPAEQTLVRLSCLDDDAQGDELAVLWEREVDAAVAGASGWTTVGKNGFDPTKLFSAYLHTLRWNGVTAADPRLMQAPFRAGIQVKAYQLEPLRKALRMPRVGLFIADDVGLGKTIEAGLIVRELLMRQRVKKIVVSCPASVVLQWRDELDRRFGLTFAVFDRDFVLARRRERGFGVNPFTTHSRFVLSHSLLRDEAYAGPLRDWLGDFEPGSLLILDEAHSAAPASGARYAIDSALTKAVRDVAPRFEHRLFLSATPHNGHSNSFSSLLELLDPLRFCRGVPVKGPKLLDAVMVRRLKGDLREIVGDLPRRDVVQVDVDGLPPDAPDLRLAELLDRYATLRAERLSGARKTAQAAAKLVTTHLQKRLFSSVEAFARTLKVHRASLEKADGKARREDEVNVASLTLLVAPPSADDDRAELSEEELSAATDAEVDRATRAALPPAGADLVSAEERALLDEMAAIAEEARYAPGPRVTKLLEWIRANLLNSSSSAPAWNRRRLLVFTEYTDTMRYLAGQLRSALAPVDRASGGDTRIEERIAVFHGGLGDETREELKAAFNAEPADHPLRILIATDSVREGVNLQNHCADLFHFDVPWNPGRMEQRNGRIDRQLQREKVVRCHYFFFTQRPEDKVLKTLVEKTETIAKELGSLSAVLEKRLGALLEGGIRRSEADALARRLESESPSDRERLAAEELEEARSRKEALAAQLDDLRGVMEASRRSLGFDDDAFREALSSSLELGKAPPLTLTTVKGRPAYRFPALDQRSGADPTWAATLDTLRRRRKRDEKPWDWRRESPPRPVVFADPGTLDDDFVHLHLEHRVARRLLGRFLSQGFVHDDLSRACCAQTRDPVPRVVLLGRLSAWGDGAARLHDEVIALAARWVEPDARKGPLRPYAETAEERTLALLEESLLASAGVPVPESTRSRLLATSATDLADLLPALRERGEETLRRVAERLADRGRREADDLRAVLLAQKARIETERAKYADPQLQLAFAEDEKRQLAADRRHQERRLADLEKELTTEPDRIRRSFEVRATRLEPVGLAYLWPVSG
ncbi:MAG TPA: DISARM system SNF2-like helicase DrmD [Thermoanaerobaculia bacterium]|nr:DISARM system SNF2-like helicase DrmD [Thermoanaerobaculia bacterium]